jgi:hypothetical protein
MAGQVDGDDLVIGDERAAVPRAGLLEPDRVVPLQLPPTQTL